MDKRRAGMGLIALSLFIGGGVAARAQDHDLLIVRAAGGEEKYSRMVGDLVDLTSEQAVIVLKGGVREQKVPLSRIVELTPRQSADEANGRRLLAAGDFDAAIDSLQRAAEKESRRWRKEELAALIAQAELGRGEIDAAGARMAPVVQADPESRLLGRLPLAWKEDFKTPNAANLAAWAGDASPAVKLLAASWMLSGEKRREAQAQLEKLASGPSRRIAALAEAQLWRTRMSTAKPLDAQRWLERVQSFPQDLRSGPYFLAGVAAARTDQPQIAAEALMRCAILHPMQTTLAAEAEFLAAGQLEKAGAVADLTALLERFTSQAEGYPRRGEALEMLTRLNGTAK